MPDAAPWVELTLRPAPWSPSCYGKSITTTSVLKSCKFGVSVTTKRVLSNTILHLPPSAKSLYLRSVKLSENSSYDSNSLTTHYVLGALTLEQVQLGDGLT